MGDAILSSYYSLYYIHNGLDANQQALLLGIIPFSLFVGCTVLSRFAKTGKSTLWLFRACALLETGLTFGFAFCHNFVSLAILTTLVAFFNGAPFAFLESHSAVAIEGKNIRYGLIRIFGTLGYAVSLLLGYFLLRDLPFEQCYFFSAAFFAIAFGLSFLMKPNPDEEKKEEVHENKGKRMHATIILVTAMVLIYGALGAMSHLLPVRLNALGLRDEDYSLMRGVTLFGEAGMMLAIPFFHRFFKKHPKLPFYFAGGGFALAMILVAVITNPFACGYSSLIVTAIAKAFLFSYSVYLFEDVVGKASLARVFTIHSGLNNLTTSLLNLSSATIYLNAGFATYFGILGGIEFIGLVLLFFLKIEKPSTEASIEGNA